MKIRAYLDQGSRTSHTWIIKPEPASPEAFHDLSVLCEDFALALDRGAFADGTGQPSCTLEQRVQGDQLVVRFDLVSVAVRYARVLRNHLYGFEQVYELPLDVEATQTPPARQPLALEVDEAEVEQETFYPASLPQLPFRLDLLDTNRPDQNRRVLFEFAAPLDVSTEQALAEAVLCWSRFAEFGYAPSETELKAGKYGIFEVVGSMFDAASYDVTVATFLAPEAAWASLLNMVAFVKGPRCVRAELE
jgi:hypothetical protein